jgi:hypothetical protein
MVLLGMTRQPDGVINDADRERLRERGTTSAPNGFELSTIGVGGKLVEGREEEVGGERGTDSYVQVPTAARRACFLQLAPRARSPAPRSSSRAHLLQADPERSASYPRHLTAFRPRLPLCCARWEDPLSSRNRATEALPQGEPTLG